MKKTVIAAILAAAMMLGACGSSDSSEKEKSADSSSSQTQSSQQETSPSVSSSPDEQTQPSASESSADNSQAKSKILVAYFTPAENGKNDAMTSASKTKYQGENMGNAAVLAKITADKTGADLVSIKTVKDYPLDYDDLIDDAKKEQKKGELPELETQIDVSGYDTVFVVYPVWWYTMPQPIYSFFDKCDFSGKTLIPITTHEGSGLADSKEKFKELEPQATVKNGYSVRGSKVGSAKDDLESWLTEQGY